MKPPEQIETERLILRKPRADDASAAAVAFDAPPVIAFGSADRYAAVSGTKLVATAPRADAPPTAAIALRVVRESAAAS